MNTIYKQGEHHDCPYCQSHNTEETSAGTYICKDCERLFDFNDTILEPVPAYVYSEPMSEFQALFADCTDF